MLELPDGQLVLSAGAVYAIIWGFTTIALITTSLRLGARTYIVKALGLDDFLIICALVSTDYQQVLHRTLDLTNQRMFVNQDYWYCNFSSSSLAYI